jgi:Flp pilus assembly protein CpaB
VQFVQRLMASRTGTIALSGLAALLAAGIFFAYLKRYRASVTEGAQPMTVLVAKGLVEKGMSGNVIGKEELFQPRELKQSDVKEGAITDPDLLRGRVAVRDVYPGTQLTTADFTTTTTTALSMDLAEDQRAIAVPVDAAHGLIGQVQSGDHVDVFGGFNVRRLQPDGRSDPDAAERPVLKLIVEDVLVLDAPDATAQGGVAAGGQTATSVTLRLTDEQAADVAFSSENGKLWIALRPRTGAKPTSPDLVTLETILFGVKPVAAARSFGGQR